MASAATAYMKIPTPSTSSAHDPSSPTHLGIRYRSSVDINRCRSFVNSRPDRGEIGFRDHEGSRLGAFQRTVLAGRRVNDVTVRQEKNVLTDAARNHRPLRRNRLFVQRVPSLRE